MALKQVKFLPGIDKQNTTVGATARWVDSDNVRFRYGLPEKVGGWSSLVANTIVGVARKTHAFVDLDGNRYVAIGTDKFLLLYFEGRFYDITPLKTTLTSATIATTNNSPTCTITKNSHGINIGDIVQLDNVTLPGGTGFSASDFEDKNFQVISSSTNTFTINQSSNASATVSTGGSLSIKPYEPVGPAEQTYGYGWGLESWSTGNWGEAASAQNITLEPGLWSLDNFGQVLIATVANGKTFTWNGGAASPLNNRASTTTSISIAAFLPISPQFVPTCSKPNVNGAPTNFIAYNALSVHTRIFSFATNAPIIFVPSCNLCVPAVFVASGV